MPRNSKRNQSKRRKLDLLSWLYCGRCFWCHGAFGDGSHNGNSLSIDELKPVSRGGFRVLSNQVPAHRGCNMQRGNTVAKAGDVARHHATLRSAGIEFE